ncbi:MAG: HD domain-containing phosphohydrolase [Actinomycetota bacterium]
MTATITPLHPRLRGGRILNGRHRAVAALEGVVDAVEALDSSTVGHSRRVAALCDAIAARAGELTSAERVALREVALLHDVGKIAVPAAILAKPGRLTAAEFARVKPHAEIGALILAGVVTAEQARWVRHHHERWDGLGYPDGIPSRVLHPAVGVLTLADAFDAMTSRAQSGRLGLGDALAECLRGAGTQFAPSAVAALLALADEGALERTRASEAVEAAGA